MIFAEGDGEGRPSISALNDLVIAVLSNADAMASIKLVIATLSVGLMMLVVGKTRVEENVMAAEDGQVYGKLMKR